MRARLFVVLSCCAALLAATMTASPARSQSAVAPTTTAAATAAATDPAADPALGDVTSDPAAADTSTDAVDSSAPELTIDVPDTPDERTASAADTSDNGQIETVTPAPQPDPTPAAAPAAETTAPVPVTPAPAADPAVITPQALPQPSDPQGKSSRQVPQTPLDPSAPPAPRIETVRPTAGGAAQAVPSASGGSDKSNPVARLPKYNPVEHKGRVQAVTAGGAAMIAALAAGLGAGAAGAAGGSRRGGGTGRGGGGGGGGGGEGGGWLDDIELERAEGGRFGRGAGDRSRSWRMPWTRRVDRWSNSWPARVAQLSPVIGRVSIDGDYLRAMIGGLYLLLFPAAIVLGVAAASSNGYYAMPPVLGFFLAILGLSIFDSMLGYTAALSFATAVVSAGHLGGAPGIREIAGLCLIWFAIPLCASAIRPLRRGLKIGVAATWDRASDLVLAGLFGAWIAEDQVSALGPLLGRELPIDAQRWTIALAAIGFIALRLLLETVAAHFYPRRLDAVEHQGELEPGNLQSAISLAIQISVLMFVASSYLHHSWALFVGTAIFFTPLVPWLFVDRLPKSQRVAKWMPAGVVKWTWVIGAGVLLSRVLDRLITDPAQAIEWGFVVLPLPVLLCWGLELFAAEDEDEEEESEEAEDEDADDQARFPMTWPMRLAGVPLTLVCFYLVYFVIG